MAAVKFTQDLLIPSGRHTLSPEEVGERQRGRLLLAIGSCVAERGYAETTIADVVAVARTSRSAFYDHFTDKEECFLEAYRQMTEGFIEASLQAAAAVESWQEKLDAGIATYFHWMSENEAVALSSVVEIHAAGRRALQARAESLDKWMRTMDGVAVLARRAGAQLPQLGETCYAAIVLTAERYVHEYARRGRLSHVAEKAPEVQAMAHTLFAHGLQPT